MNSPSANDDASARPALSGIARAERISALVAIVLAAFAAIYLYVTLFAAHEVCYGLSATKLLCQPVDALAVGRATVVWSFLGVLFLVTAFGGWWHAATTEPTARNTAFGLTFTTWLVLILLIIPGATGAGFYLAPAALAITATAILATVKFIQEMLADRAAHRQWVESQK